MRSLTSRGVPLTHTQYKVLFEMAQWCSQKYGYVVRPWVYDPVASDGSPLRDKDGLPQLGLLSRLNLPYNSYLHHISALQRICEPCRVKHAPSDADCGHPGLITRTKHGHGSRPRKDGRKNPSKPSEYRLNVRRLSLTNQESLFRTEPHELSEKHMKTVHELPEKHMKTVHELPEKHMKTVHELPEKHMKPVHELTEKHMKTVHVLSGPHLLRNTYKGPDTSTEPPLPPPQSDATTRESGGGGGGSFCSTFLVPALSGLLPYITAEELNFVDDQADAFEQRHGSYPDQREAEYMAKQLRRFLRDEDIDPAMSPHRVFGFLRKQSQLVLTSSMLLARPPEPEPAPEPEPRQTAAEAPVSDEEWAILHQYHVVEGTARQPSQIWDVVLGELMQQVARPAFQTWLIDTVGLAHANGEFVVGTANAFVSEMLEHRMYPLIERAVEHVVGAPATVRFQVVALTAINDQSDCPLCKKAEV